MEGWGDFAYLHRRAIVALGVALAVGASVLSLRIFEVVEPFGFEDPDSESARAYDQLEEATGELAEPGVVLLLEPSQPAGSAGWGTATRRAAEELRRVPGISRALTPAPSDPALVGTDRRSALVLGYIDSDVDDPTEIGELAQQRFEGQPAVTVGGPAVAGDQINEVSEDDLRRIELLVAPVLFLLAFFVFRGPVAAALPLLVGAISIATTLAALRGLAEAIDLDVFALNIVSGVGLGLAIDYSLFIVSRFREELEQRDGERAALRATLAGAGRMIAFSALIVTAALAALIVFPQRFLYSIGIGGALVALISGLVALTVLPATLALLGRSVNALSPSWLQRRDESQRWYSLARFVTRRPLPIAVLATAIMVAAALPALRMDLVREDPQGLPEERSARQVDDALRARFAADPSSNLVVVIGARPSAEFDDPTKALALAPQVSAVAPPRPLGETLTRIDASLDSGPFSEGAADLVDRARGIDWGSPSSVTGPSAELADQKQSLADHAPLAVAIIVASSLFGLLALTRSVVMPFLALFMNLLTVSVAFGVVVLVFQEGRFEALLDYRGEDALDISMPILLFAAAFGLSTDYGVFMISRIAEARRERRDDSEAIAVGLQRSGRIITAAALLFAVAIGAFVFSSIVSVQEVALGIAVAVLVDATIVRALLFPALLRLAGKWAWWAPGPR